METNGVSSPYRHRNSPSTDRFLSLFAQPENPSSGGTIAEASVVGDELDEDEVFWTGDFSEPKPRSNRHRFTAINRNHHNYSTFLPPENSGVLAVLPEEGMKRTPSDRSVIYRKTLFPPSSSSSSSRMIPSLPKSQFLHDREFSRSEQAERFPHSAPVNVPVPPNARNVREVEESDEETEKELLPPHEIVAKGASNTETTFSVLEGVGRTLKGRDLRQVRNAVWRKTVYVRLGTRAVSNAISSIDILLGGYFPTHCLKASSCSGTPELCREVPCSKA